MLVVPGTVEKSQFSWVPTQFTGFWSHFCYQWALSPHFSSGFLLPSIWGLIRHLFTHKSAKYLMSYYYVLDMCTILYQQKKWESYSIPILMETSSLGPCKSTTSNACVLTKNLLFKGGKEEVVHHCTREPNQTPNWLQLVFVILLDSLFNLSFFFFHKSLLGIFKEPCR